MTTTNIATYRFVELTSTELSELKAFLGQTAEQLALKGTILLSPEGINLSLAGTHATIAQFKRQLESLTKFKGLTYHHTYSKAAPFQKLFIKIKKQIIPYADGNIPSKNSSAPYITPNKLLAWLKTKQDITLLDARNQYEVAAGSFQNALSLSLKHFRSFPEKATQLPVSLKQKPIVTFCTGGIRCEKAAATLLAQGFKEVYQLKGGILNYFKAHGEEYYQGGCFVFDNRGIIRAKALLNPS